jgi:hypothetical protein
VVSVITEMVFPTFLSKLVVKPTSEEKLVNAFSNIKPETAVTEILNEYCKEPTNTTNGEKVTDIPDERLEEFKGKLYPAELYAKIKVIDTKPTADTPEAISTANTATIKNRGDAVRNFFLFGDIKEPELKSIDLKGEDFKDIYNNIKDTRNCESPFTKLTESFKKALTAIDTAEKGVKVDSTNEGQASTPVQDQTNESIILKNIGKILAATQQASQAVNAAAIDALVGIPTKSTGYDAFKKSFWGRNYSMFKAVIDEYKTRDKDFKPGEENNNTDNATQDTTPTPTKESSTQPVTPIESAGDPTLTVQNPKKQ